MNKTLINYYIMLEINAKYLCNDCSFNLIFFNRRLVLKFTPPVFASPKIHNIGHMTLSGISWMLTHLHHITTATCLLESCPPVNFKFYPTQIVSLLSDDSTWRDLKVHKTFTFLRRKVLEQLLTLERTHVSLHLLILTRASLWFDE